MKKRIISAVLLLIMVFSLVACSGAGSGRDGENGLSAYDIAVENGFEGNQEEWLESLKGASVVSAYINEDTHLILVLSDGTEIDAGYVGVEATLRHTVAFEDGNGNVLFTQKVADNGTLTYPENPEMEGFTFLGWYSDVNNAAPFDFDTPITAPITLYAKWIEGSIDLDDPEGTGSNVSVYAVYDVKVDPIANTATAIVSAPENCAVIIRFIDEEIFFSSDYPNNKYYIDDGYLYASHVVPADSSTKEIVCDITGSLPDHYIAEAVLIDVDGNSLCDSYSTIEYSARYEQFENTTTDSFDEDDVVINFDEDETNNFGVLADDVKIITADSITEEFVGDSFDVIYKIVNPSEEIYVGDKIHVASPENTVGILLMVSDVSSSINEFTVIPTKITEENLQYTLSDFYKFLKVDTAVSGSATTDEEPDVSPVADTVGFLDPELSADGSLSLSLAPISIETEHFEARGHVQGTIGASFYFLWDIRLFGEDYVQCDITFSTDLEAELDVKAKLGNGDDIEEQLKNQVEHHEISLGKVRIPFGVLGVNAFTDMKTLVEWKLTAGFSAKTSVKSTTGFTYNSNAGKQDINEKEVSSSVNCEGYAEVSFGPKPTVGIELLGGLVSADFELFLGIKAEAEAIAPLAQGGDSRHACNLCIDGNIHAVIEASFKLKLALTDKLSSTPIDETLGKVEFKIFDFYISLLNERDSIFGGRVHLGIGDCPNHEYLVSVYAKDHNTTPVDTTVEIYEKATGFLKATVQSNSTTYLQPSIYVAKATIDDIQYEQEFAVIDGPKTVTVCAEKIQAYVKGDVRDATTGSGVPNATITVVENSTVVAVVETLEDGSYEIPLEEGSYTITINAENYIVATQEVVLGNGDTKYLQTLLLVEEKEDSIMGGIFGLITDATTGEHVSGVKIQMTPGWGSSPLTSECVFETETDYSGQYSHLIQTQYGIDFGIDAGNYTVTVSKDGYVTTTVNVTIVAGENMEFNAPLSPVGSENEIRIVLRWGEYPSDLDSHFTSVRDGITEHIFYSNMQVTSAFLDLDDTTSYGPETITIPDSTLYPGNILYSVHDYSNRDLNSSTALSNSTATVEVFVGGQLVYTFHVPTEQVGTVWNVFYIDEFRNIRPVNTFENIEDPDYVCGSTGN